MSSIPAAPTRTSTMRIFHLLLPWALVTPVKVVATWPFSPKPPVVQGLVNTGSLGLDGFDGRVVAFGDWNGNQYLDLITLTADSKTVQIWLWNRVKYKYEPSHILNLPSVVHNVIPADYNLDGRLDLLILSEAQEQSDGGWWGGSSKNELRITVNLGGGEMGGFRESTFDGTLSSTQPLVVDSDGSLKPSLLGMNARGIFELWLNNGTAFETKQSPLQGSRVCTLAHPHSSAFVDMNGDCKSDVVLHCEAPKTGRKSLQIWTMNKDGGFALSKQFDLPDGAGPVTFADMDRDGTTDIIFPTCDRYSLTNGVGYDCSINIAYNKQVPMCSGVASVYAREQLRCRGWGELCAPDDSFAFDLDPEGDSFTSIPLTALYPAPDGDAHLQLYVPSSGSGPLIPLPLRVGDFNQDGYPDILFLLSNSTAAPSTGGLFGGSHRRSGIQPKLLESVACRKNRRECWGKVEKGRRTFNDATAHHRSLDEIWDGERVAWLDIDDDGSLDILIQRSGEQDGQHFSFIVNNMFHDAFFMKTLVLNGACDGDCQPREGGATYKGLGVSYAGASSKFTVLDTAGRRVAAQVSQLPQAGYHALGTPYAFVGLGRTNNYVETLVVGTTLRGPNSLSILESLVPNSQVIINPPSPLALVDDAQYGSLKPSTQWRNELFLQPGDWIPWVGAAVVITVLLLGGVVVMLGEKEKREDERERRRALHSINFQAL